MADSTTTDHYSAAQMNLRRAGSPWRILVHEWGGREPGMRDGMYGTAHHVKSSPREGLSPTSPTPVDDEYSRNHILPGTEFDELVVGRWIHLEQQDPGRWWMSIGGVTVLVAATRDGQPTCVDVFGPMDYGAPVDGCEYHCTWSTDPDPRRSQ